MQKASQDYYKLLSLTLKEKPQTNIPAKKNPAGQTGGSDTRIPSASSDDLGGPEQVTSCTYPSSPHLCIGIAFML